MVFDIELLAARLGAASHWLSRDADTRCFRLGYFGASTGAAAALSAAARRPGAVAAVISRGGRPDLAWDDLPEVTAPTLLIVGSRDLQVLELNKQALALLRCPKELFVVPGATHLFEEPGTLEQVANLAVQWFLRHLGTDPRVGSAPSSTNDAAPIPNTCQP
jgi:pimeloyl-ACP methyl ester carboxylesterase